jgi:hypothetical protein
MAQKYRLHRTGEWESMLQGVTGAGLLVLPSATASFFDTFPGSGCARKHYQAAREAEQP